MTIAPDPRSFLYRDALDPDAAKALTADALARADDGELYLQYRRSEAFGFDDGRLKTPSPARPPPSHTPTSSLPPRSAAPPRR